jgi:transposase
MSTLAEQINGVIGVDTHRDTLAAAAVSALGAILANAEAATDVDGYLELLEFARRYVPPAAAGP